MSWCILLTQILTIGLSVAASTIHHNQSDDEGSGVYHGAAVLNLPATDDLFVTEYRNALEKENHSSSVTTQTPLLPLTGVAVEKSIDNGSLTKRLLDDGSTADEFLDGESEEEKILEDSSEANRLLDIETIAEKSDDGSEAQRSWDAKLADQSSQYYGSAAERSGDGETGVHIPLRLGSAAHFLDTILEVEKSPDYVSVAEKYTVDESATGIYLDDGSALNISATERYPDDESAAEIYLDDTSSLKIYRGDESAAETFLNVGSEMSNAIPPFTDLIENTATLTQAFENTVTERHSLIHAKVTIDSSGFDDNTSTFKEGIYQYGVTVSDVPSEVGKNYFSTIDFSASSNYDHDSSVYSSKHASESFSLGGTMYEYFQSFLDSFNIKKSFVKKFPNTHAPIVKPTQISKYASNTTLGTEFDEMEREYLSNVPEIYGSLDASPVLSNAYITDYVSSTEISKHDRRLSTSHHFASVIDMPNSRHTTLNNSKFALINSDIDLNGTSGISGENVFPNRVLELASLRNKLINSMNDSDLSTTQVTHYIGDAKLSTVVAWPNSVSVTDADELSSINIGENGVQQDDSLEKFRRNILLLLIAGIFVIQVQLIIGLFIIRWCLFKKLKQLLSKESANIYDGLTKVVNFRNSLKGMEENIKLQKTDGSTRVHIMEAARDVPKCLSLL